jgi:NADH-quinone oxidoreductase subunit L
VNRIGDFGFMLAVFLIVIHFKSLDFRNRFRPGEEHAGGDALGMADCDRAAAASGCDRKIGADSAVRVAARRDGWPDSGQRADPRGDHGHRRRLHGHALVPLSFTHTTEALNIVAIVGLLTAFVAATIGMAQNDIKKVFAYSTVSQLGYMFLALGAGAFSAGIFHLMTHAFFKALLFLGAGAVIHAVGGNQDMRSMGGLRTKIPDHVRRADVRRRGDRRSSLHLLGFIAKKRF